MAGTISLNTVAKNACWESGIKSVFADGVIRCYGGTPTAVGTAITTETVLAEITESGGAWSSGSATNGLELGSASSGEIEKAAAETWSGEGTTDSSTLTWFRFFTNDLTGWIQGTINTTGAVMTVTTTAIDDGTPVTVTSFKLRF